MAIDTYMIFFPQSGPLPKSESQIQFAKTEPTKTDPFANLGTDYNAENVFEVEDYSWDIEQTLNIGSQSTGAGAGKVVFNPLRITRKVDVFSSTLFQMCCAGTTFKYVDLLVRKPTGGEVASATFLAMRFGLVAVKTLGQAHDDESPKETVAFEYGALSVQYAKQNPNGTFTQTDAKGWNRVKNVAI